MNLHFNRYLKFINWCDARPLFGDERTQVHHILPRCFGGDNSADNLITLTVREHILAHRLLALAFPNNPDLWCAYNFSSRGKISPKERDYFSMSRKGENNPMYGKTFIMSEAQKQQISKSRTGQKASEETKAKLREAAKHRPPRSKETCKKLSEALKGKIKPPEHSERMSKLHKGKIITTEHRKAITDKLSDKKLYLFSHKDHGERLCYANQLREEFPELLRAGLSNLKRGVCRKYKGWGVTCPLEV